MATTSGLSHGFSAFGTLIVGTLLSKFIWDIVPPLGELSLLTIELIRSTTGAELPANEQFAGTLVVMVGLSFAWGIIYHVGRHS
ncbi:hypothetical protein ACFQDG_02055 [Natronoarchaeum mannanilyticum]|uniref:Uncharacterized protein n=1 Tax=Natronoarchaeum mannanilyticum TaxID=926360 RepID=A0AAV3T8X8_9EURY